MRQVKIKKTTVVAASVAAAVMVLIGIAVWLWPDRDEPEVAAPPVAVKPPASQPAGPPPVRLVTRPPVKDRLSESTFVGTDGRMYSSYDTDGDGLYDADEIRQYGTLMYDPYTRQNAGSIEYVEAPNPDDTDGDGLPDEWEMGYFGKLAFGPDDDPDGDGFPNSVEFSLGAKRVGLSGPTIPPRSGGRARRGCRRATRPAGCRGS